MDATVISLAERRAAAGRTPREAGPTPRAAGRTPREAGTPRPARQAGPGPSAATTARGRPDARAWRRAIGHLLRASRQEADLRLVDVAQAAGVSPQYLSEVERGRKEPSSEVLAAVTSALGMTLTELARDLSHEVAAPTGGVRCLAA